jgi:multicomponent K+:H+ antiporter subunit F
MLNHVLPILGVEPADGSNPFRVEEFPIDATPAEAWMRSALFVGVDVVTICLFLAIGVCLWRMVKGPTVVDRGIAADTLSLQVIGLAILLCVRMSTIVGFDVVLIIAILGFVSTLAFAQFVGRKGLVST